MNARIQRRCSSGDCTIERAKHKLTPDQTGCLANGVEQLGMSGGFFVTNPDKSLVLNNASASSRRSELTAVFPGSYNCPRWTTHR